jgi:hypothetical protein
MSEPTLWAKRGPIPSRPAFQWKDGQRVPVVDDFGRQVFERVPQSGKVGLVRQVADIEGLKPQGQPRFITFLHMDGNICNDPITSAAASTPGTDKSFEIGIRQKARREGWVQWGLCPIDAAQRRDITRLQLMAPSNREAYDKRQACAHDAVGPRKPPCPHFDAEIEARRKIRADVSAKAERKSAAERQADAIAGYFEKQAQADESRTEKPRRQKGEPSE